MLSDEIAGTSSVDIPMSEGPVNLNWGPIMKHINESPYEFFQQGGWNFLGGAGGAVVSISPLDWPRSDLATRVITLTIQTLNRNSRPMKMISPRLKAVTMPVILLIQLAAMRVALTLVATAIVMVDLFFFE
jgi:hypothetical protein